MAKVYSWEVSNSPKKYAYIVHPDDYNKAYVGTELKGTKLENVKDWAAACTDTQYEAQFNKMVALCKSKGYNVEFETAVAYMDIESTCDNLRGPAGRGIDHITLKDVDEFRNVNIYEIVYDDGETDTFEIRNGKDGQNGRDGRDGAQGDAGVSSKLIMIYTSGVDEFGNTFTPARPTGGSYNFDTYEFTRPDEGIWNLNDSDLTPPIWMSSRTFSSSPASTDKEWSLPVQLTGESGKPGVDGVSTEFIYYRDKNEPSVENLASPNEAGYVPPKETGWTASPQGVDEDNQTEWASTRKLDRATNVWGKWSKAFRWSQYGVNGQDGDGVQYIYLKNSGQIVENPTPANYKTNETYQNRDNEWVPAAGVTYTNINWVQVKYSALEERTDDLPPAGVWTDNPSDLTANFHSQWVCSRKYRKGSDGKMAWDKFSDPALWARYGQDGKNATSIRKLYALSSDTKTYPPIPKDTNATSEWGSGFPKDYEVGVNVVWAIEAEIWAHNFEFVKTYKLASSVDEDGNVVPPSDATTSNTIDVQSIPNEEVKGYAYICLNGGDYYAWSGGWSAPYIVTGVKGENGEPINYTTYVYAFGYTNYPPEAPTGTSPKYPGESTDGLGSRILWYDFPNSNVGMDGYIDPSNKQEMRWYQCVGYVNGRSGEVEAWSDVQPCNGHDGTVGPQGNRTEIRFGVTADSTKPILIQKVEGFDEIRREPELYDSKGNKMGWFATDEKLPEVPSGGTMWQIWALIDGATDKVIVQDGKGWHGPVRVSGEKGEQGIQGPAGMRGVTGIPGAKSIQMYCLGTYGKNEKSESFWKSGDGYFGSDNYESNALIDNMDGWFIAKDMPYSNIIKVYSLEELTAAAASSSNVGRVVNHIKSEEVNVGPTGSTSTFTHTTHQYHLIGKNGTYETLTQELDPSEEFNVYVWCIQGNEIWQAGPSSSYVNITKYDNNGNVIPPEGSDETNTVVRDSIPSEKDGIYTYILCNNKYYEWKEIDGDKVTHVLTGIEWGNPFKLQGTNGLRGLSGARGQVVYPMGVYNSEEVYITTEDKAPYVYDPNDGMYYVYNNTEHPWVGLLPGKQEELFKTILVHPADVNSNNVCTSEDDPLTSSEIFDCKYVYYKDKYYTWNGSKYVMASKYKYSIDGSGAKGTWMTDQNGDAPANNYANAINANDRPQWVRFESFKALYTSIGIIENGLVGSAVFNNEFMFSQQGIGKDGNPTNYAVVSGRDTSYGFLSGYKYDEKGKVTEKGEVLHWQYVDTDEYINEFEVNPYEKDASGNYIHTFMPNVCINFATGQMWLSAGQIRFGGRDDRNVSTTNEVKQELQMATNLLRDVIKDNSSDLQNQIDKSATTYYQANDPSNETGSPWQITDNTKLSTYAPERIGDMWFNTSKHKSYIFAQTTGGVPQTIKDNGTYLDSTNSTLKNAGYYWVESDVPESVYNRINSRSKIFVEEPVVPYYVGDLWFVHQDYDDKNEFYDGENKTTKGMKKETCLVCMKSSDSSFDTKHWGKRDHYADEADVIEMSAQLTNWSNDGLLSPVERQSLKNEYDSIVAEYDSIIAQAKTCSLENETVYKNYTNAYTKAKQVLEYYTNSKNVDTNTDCIKILYADKKNDKNEDVYCDYGHIKTYYEKRQLLLQAISDALNKNINDTSDKLTKYIESNDLFLAQVGDRLSNAESGITEINNSGFVAEGNFAEMFSTKVLTDNGGNVTKELKSFIKTEAEKITISSEDIFINGNTYINGQFNIDTDGKLTVKNADIKNCTITDVTINGSLCNPFVLDDDTEKVDNVYHDNFSFYTDTEYEFTTTFGNNLKWDVDQSGRKVTIVNHKWDNRLSKGRVKINTPSYFSLPYVGYWERDTTLTNKSSGISNLGLAYFEAYTLESLYPTRAFMGSQDLFQFQIPPGRTIYSIYIKNEKIIYDADYNRDDNNYVIVSNINKEIPYTSGDGETPVVNTNVKQVLQLTNGSYVKITFSNITEETAIVSVAVKQHSLEANKYIATLLLPKSTPDKMFFYENGQAKQSITLNRELVNLIGYGDTKNFYGWIVENRADIETRYLYGKNLKTLAFGCIRYIKQNKVMTIDKDTSYVCTFDGTPVSIGRYAIGKYQIGFDSSWNDTLSYCTVLTSGYGLVTDGKTSTATSKSTHMPFVSGKISGITNGIEVWVSDDASLNDGGFYFLITNYNDLPTLRYH